MIFIGHLYGADVCVARQTAADSVDKSQIARHVSINERALEQIYTRTDRQTDGQTAAVSTRPPQVLLTCNSVEATTIEY